MLSSTNMNRFTDSLKGSKLRGVRQSFREGGSSGGLKALARQFVASLPAADQRDLAECGGAPQEIGAFLLENMGQIVVTITSGLSDGMVDGRLGTADMIKESASELKSMATEYADAKTNLREDHFSDDAVSSFEEQETRLQDELGLSSAGEAAEAEPEPELDPGLDTGEVASEPPTIAERKGIVMSDDGKTASVGGRDYNSVGNGIFTSADNYSIHPESGTWYNGESWQPLADAGS